MVSIFDFNNTERFFKGHQSKVTSVCIGGWDMDKVITGSMDKTARTWGSLAVYRTKPDPSFLQDGVMDMGEMPRCHVTSMCHVNNGPYQTYLITASSDKIARMWSTGASRGGADGKTPGKNEVVREFKGPLVEKFRKATEFEISMPHVREMRRGNDGNMYSVTKHNPMVLAVCVTMDGKHLITGSDDKTARMWSLEDGRMVREFKGHDGDEYLTTRFVSSVCTTLDGKYLITGYTSNYMHMVNNPPPYSGDSTACMWSLEDGTMVREFKGHENYVTSVCLIREKKYRDEDQTWWTLEYLITGSDDKTARMWSLETGNCLHVFKGHENYVTSVCTTLNGKYLITGSSDKTAIMWSLEHLALKNSHVKSHRHLFGRMVREFQHESSVNSVCTILHGDKEYLITGSDDKMARMWSLEDVTCGCTIM